MLEVIQSLEFAAWLSKLKDTRARARILIRLERMAEGNFGDVKPVGEGVSEARIHYGTGYRIYFTQKGRLLVVMLAGGNKSSQQRDIVKAKQRNSEWR